MEGTWCQAQKIYFKATCVLVGLYSSRSTARESAHVDRKPSMTQRAAMMWYRSCRQAYGTPNLQAFTFKRGAGIYSSTYKHTRGAKQSTPPLHGTGRKKETSIHDRQTGNAHAPPSSATIPPAVSHRSTCLGLGFAAKNHHKYSCTTAL